MSAAIVIEPRGQGEWIVSAPPDTGSLHVYRLGPADWLVSEVGRGNEGRGAALSEALATLATGASRPEWWEGIAALLDDGEEGHLTRASAN